jgi:hypothetical protein
MSGDAATAVVRCSAAVLELSSALAWGIHASAQGCVGAPAITIGTALVGTPQMFVQDGSGSTCQGGTGTRAAYATLTPSISGVYTLSLCNGTAWDTVLSVHTACPALPTNEVAGSCDDDGCRPPGSTEFGFASRSTAWLAAGTTYIVRVGSYNASGPVGPFMLMVTAPSAPQGACCTGSACAVVTRASCESGGGTYRGDATICLAPGGQLTRYPGVVEPSPAPIPDNDPAGLVSEATVSDEFAVAEVRLRVTLNHTFAGDVGIELVKDGQRATIMRKLGGGLFGVSSNFAGEYIFSDAAPSSIWGAAVQAAQQGTNTVIAPGIYRAVDERAARVSLRQIFGGRPAAGGWTLRVVDAGPGDTGTVVSWSVELDRPIGGPGRESNGCEGAVVGLGACCFGPVPGLGGLCTVDTAAGCAKARAAFRGVGSLCTVGPNNPVACCPANFDLVAGLSPTDIFSFLDGYFAGDARADFNADGVRTPADIFAFLNAYFAKCR